MKITNLNLGIVMPTNHPMIYTDVMDAFNELERPDYIWIRPKNGNISDMRNMAVEQARNYNCSHVFMFDADMVLHKKTITKLLQNDLDICGALCFERYPPFIPVMFKVKDGDFDGKLQDLTFEAIKEWEKDSIVECDIIGTGAIMINMNVFENIDINSFDRMLKTKQDDNEIYFGEDFSFCLRARKAGFRIYMDTSIPAGHIAKYNIKEDDFRLATWLKENKNNNKNKKGEINVSKSG